MGAPDALGASRARLSLPSDASFLSYAMCAFVPPEGDGGEGREEEEDGGAGALYTEEGQDAVYPEAAQEADHRWRVLHRMHLARAPFPPDVLSL